VFTSRRVCLSSCMLRGFCLLLSLCERGGRLSIYQRTHTYYCCVCDLVPILWRPLPRTRISPPVLGRRHDHTRIPAKAYLNALSRHVSTTARPTRHSLPEMSPERVSRCFQIQPGGSLLAFHAMGPSFAVPQVPNNHSLL
jgi:hypothetical protein